MRALEAAVIGLLVPVLAGGVLAGGSPAARAQSLSADDTTELADEIIGCAGLTAEAERLKCFDRVAAPLMGLGDSPQSGTADALQSFTGKGDWDSDVVEFERPWRLVWQSQGSLLTVELHSAQGELVDVIGNQIGKGGGRSEVLEPGSYRLAVRGLGGWRVQAVSDPKQP
ncbi:MAG: hypothetical protein ACFB13_14090 [Kiloniellaceae bacterium]